MRLTNANRAAVLVTITLTFQVLYTCIVQMQLWASLHQLSWIIVVLFALQLLLASPLPAVFWILGTTHITLIASSRRRYLALIIACVEVLALAIPQLYRLLKSVHQHPGFGWYDTVAEQFWRWLNNPWVAAQLTRIPHIVSELALALFRITLFRQKNVVQIVDHPARQLARRFAAAAIFICAIPFVLGVIRLCYSAAMIHKGLGQGFWVETEPPTQFISQVTMSQLANLCFTATAWIIYRGLSDSYAKELTLEPQLDPLPS
jgi:hypothetical protein